MTSLDEIRLLARRWIEQWQGTWTHPDDPELDAANNHLYSKALAWIDRPVVPEVCILGADWLCVAARAAEEMFEDCEEDELCPGWAQLDREIIELYERLRVRYAGWPFQAD